MSKFEHQIKNSKHIYTPTDDFVAKTMAKIAKRQPGNRSWHLKIWLPIMAGGLAVLVLLILPTHQNAAKQLNISPASQSTTKPQSSNANTTTAPTSQSTSQPASGSAGSGTDNASLNSELNSISGSMGQESKDQQAANNALNDNQQEINVPTE